MPRGSKPGERRGGRQRGTPNKKTLLQNAVFLAAAEDPNRSPLDFMLALMRDLQVPLDTRLDVAVLAAPFVHARPAPARNKRPDPLDLRDRLGDPADLKFGKLEAKASNGDGGGPLSPLDFLLGVMSDPTATPRQRVKAAGVAAHYKHAAAGPEAPTMMVAEDKFGFKVDPDLACAERDDRVRESRLKLFKERSAEGIAAKPELEKIQTRRTERLAQVKFPDGYTYGDREPDQKRLGELYSKRLARKRLTPEEDAEETHLAVRVLNPKVVKPEVKLAEWCLEMEWPTTRIAELDERVVGGEDTDCCGRGGTARSAAPVSAKRG